MAAITTNISDLNNLSNGPSRLAVTRGGIGNAASITDGMLYANNTNSLNIMSLGTNNAYFRATGSGLAIVSTGSPMWAGSSATTISPVGGQGLIVSASTLVTLSLPTSFVAGEQIGVVGQGSGGWELQAGTGTTIKYGTTTTSSGGTLSSSNRYDNCILIGIVASTTWAVLSSLSSGLTVT